MKYKYVGQPYLRPDAINKVTGKAIYLDDVRLPGMLYAAVLRPKYAHANILKVDTSEAEKLQGVVKVVTGKGCTFRYGDNIRDLQPMAVTKVRYIGDPVAAVIADSPAHARAALDKIVVEYEPLPVYIDARDAMAKDAVLIHEDMDDYWRLLTLKQTSGTNIANTYHLIKGKGEAGFDEADVVVEGEFNYPFGSCAAIEPHGTIVWFKEDKTIEVWSTSICPFIIREDLAHSYDVPISDVRVHITDLGGCFGYKSDITTEQTIAWIASFVPGHPVKWMGTREEDFTSTLLAHGIRTKMKMGAKKDGSLVALKTIIYHSGGAYADTAVNVTIASTHNSSGPYEFKHCDLTGYTVYTNTPAVGAYRGYGHQESQLATERMMDLMARKLGMDPLEFRKKNFLCEGKINAVGEKMYKHHGDLLACANRLENILAASPKPKEDEQFIYGRAQVTVMKSPKGAPFSTKGCYMKMNVDGSVNINMGGAEVGQGLRTVIKQVAAEALQIPPEKIRVYNEIDTQFSPYEWQTIGSMFTTQGGRAVIRAADKLIASLKKTAAQVLKADEDFMEYNGEYVYLRNDPDYKVAVGDLARGYITEDGITIGELAQSVSDARLPRYSNPDANGQGSIGVDYTMGSQAVDIKIEKKTGKILVDHYYSVFDVGQVINPLQIRGSVLGGVMMSIGAALYEEVVFDKDGKVVNPHYFKYHLPTFKEAPRQTIEFVETPDPIGPFGARGIGEHSVIGAAPAILNAVYDAIGVDFFEIPMTPEKVKAVLDSRKETK
jgi:carbon-monoxide dehydrogenase large subunit